MLFTLPGWPVRGVMIGIGAPVGPTTYAGETAGRAAAGTPGKGTTGAPAGAIRPRTAEMTGGTAGPFAPPTMFGVLPTGGE